MTGQLPVVNLSLYTLIDSGATYSFMSRKVVDKLEGTRVELTHPFITVTSAGICTNPYIGTRMYLFVLSVTFFMPI